MGQKTNPVGFRLALKKNWQSVWYAKKANFGKFLHQDCEIRKFILSNPEMRNYISNIVIRRMTEDRVSVYIYSHRPGIIIGKKGEDIDKLKKALEKLVGINVSVNTAEVKQPSICPNLVANFVAKQLEDRVNYRKAMRKAMRAALMAGVEGIKITCSGRLGGADIARSEWLKEGKLPLNTMRSDISYASAQAHTTYGCCGVKIWICYGVLVKKPQGGYTSFDPLQTKQVKKEAVEAKN